MSSISEHYNRRMDTAFEGMQRFGKLVDDVVIYDKDPQTHVQHVRKFLQRCNDRGISLNREKFVFSKGTVSFAGYTLSSSGYSIDTQLVKAIINFPEPTTVTELRSFFGLVNQLSLFTDQIAELLQPLRRCCPRRTNTYGTKPNLEHSQLPSVRWLHHPLWPSTTQPVQLHYRRTQATCMVLDSS